MMADAGDDDDDAQAYFAYSSDDMLPSKLLMAGGNVNGGGNETAMATTTAASGGLVPGNSSQVAETTIPNFLLKLWKLVEDERFNHCIGWDTTGFSFHVRDPYGFSKDVLPLYFKHSNLNSFIRQLNMYGFRKVTNLEKGALKQQTDHESLEFQHPYFVRGHPELLDYIKRKISNPRPAGELDIQQASSGGGGGGGVRGLNHVLEELRQLREKQFGMDAKLNQIKKENGAVWREVAHMRQLHMKQQQVVNKLIQFLLSLVQPATGKRLGKRQLLAIGPGLLAAADNKQQHDSLKHEQPAAKRMRQTSADSTASSTNNAVEMIESLEQELQNSGRLSSFMSPAAIGSGAGGGPIIADVTDELDAYDGVVMNNDPPSQHQQQQVDSPASGTVVSANSAATDLYGNVDPVALVVPETGGGALDLLENPSTAGLSFDVLSPEADAFANLTTPVISASTSTQKSILPPPQPLSLSAESTDLLASSSQCGPVAVGGPISRSTSRPAFNRSISETVNGGAAAATYSNSNNQDWTGRGGAQTGVGDQGKWSKPEFSEYVDFVQTDLDSLRDFLTSGSFNVDHDSLSSLFTMADESNTLAADSAPLPVVTSTTSSSAEISGNEVQLYKRPELLVVPEESAAVGGYTDKPSAPMIGASSNAAVATTGKERSKIAAPMPPPSHQPRQIAPTLSVKMPISTAATWSRQQQQQQQQQQQPAIPSSQPPIHHHHVAPVISSSSSNQPVAAVQSAASQPIYLLSTAGGSPQRIVFGVPAAPPSGQMPQDGNIGQGGAQYGRSAAGKNVRR